MNDNVKLIGATLQLLVFIALSPIIVPASWIWGWFNMPPRDRRVP